MTSSLAHKRVAIYARFSSRMQRDASIDDQVRLCRQHVERLGGAVRDDMIFSDAARSGASLARDGFQRLMALVMAKPRLVDTIVVEDTSRLSREMADAAAVFRQLEYLDVTLISVGDGVDTGRDSAEIALGFKSVMDHVARKEIGRRTRRGQEGQAIAGFATGGLPLGFRSTPVEGPAGKLLGHRVVVLEDEAGVIRRIFSEYAAGRSYTAIADRLTKDGIPAPRARRGGRRDWVASTIREMLRNESYVGRFSFGKRRWIKEPGTGKRRYRPGEPGKVVYHEHPECRIVDDTTWFQVQARLAGVAAKYAGRRTTRTMPGHRTNYVLSGLLYCVRCGAPVVISGGSSARYYLCGTFKKRRSCENRLAVREDTARRCIFAAIRELLVTPAAVDHLRRRIAEYLGRLAREASSELQERQARLTRTESRIRGVIQFICDGDHSNYMRKTLLDLEAQAMHETAAIATLRAQSKAPVRLPAPEQVLARALDLERTLAADPVRAREALRRLLEDGRISLEPGVDGVYVATFTFLPMVLVADEGPGAASVGVPVSLRLA